MSTSFPVLTHTRATTFSLATLVTLPAGVWTTASTLVTTTGQLVDAALTESLSALPTPDAAITWGVVANNIGAVLGLINPASLTIGAITGWLVWNSTEEERLFAQVCAAERVKNPALRCTYKRE